MKTSLSLQEREPDLIKLVVTTIQSPTPSMIKWSCLAGKTGIEIIVIGDRKGPSRFELPQCRFVAFQEQLGMPYRLAKLLPPDHYSRKNLGYLLAMEHSARCIYETDDDNSPLRTWQPRNRETRVTILHLDPGWLNIYKRFTHTNIWPRGLPLDEIRTASDRVPRASENRTIQAPIQQGLADGSPDVDAVWRLTLDRPVKFIKRTATALPPGVWCPFNSQSTWWWPEAYMLMYLPSHCSFRMTDIWRSFIAQRCLWEVPGQMVFHSSEVKQIRNAHNLLRDFTDEIPGYLYNGRIRHILEDISLASGPSNMGQNMIQCYEALINANIIGSEEMTLVSAWVNDAERVLS